MQSLPRAEQPQKSRARRKNWGIVGSGLTLLTFVLGALGVGVPGVVLLVALAISFAMILHGLGAWTPLRQHLPILITIGHAQSLEDQKRAEQCQIVEQIDEFVIGLTELLSAYSRGVANSMTRNKRAEIQRLIRIYEAEHRQTAVKLVEAAALSGVRSPGLAMAARQPADAGDIYALRDSFQELSDRLLAAQAGSN